MRKNGETMNDAAPAGRFASSWLHFLGLCQRTGSCSVKEKGAARGMKWVLALPATSSSAIYHSKKQHKFNTFLILCGYTCKLLFSSWNADISCPTPSCSLSLPLRYYVSRHHPSLPPLPSFVCLHCCIHPSIHQLVQCSCFDKGTATGQHIYHHRPRPFRTLSSDFWSGV